MVGLNTVEGVPAYGPVAVSLNTTGRTTPSSFLDVTRFPVSKGVNVLEPGEIAPYGYEV